MGIFDKLFKKTEPQTERWNSGWTPGPSNNPLQKYNINKTACGFDMTGYEGECYSCNNRNLNLNPMKSDTTRKVVFVGTKNNVPTVAVKHRRPKKTMFKTIYIWENDSENQFKTSADAVAYADELIKKCEM